VTKKEENADDVVNRSEKKEKISLAGTSD